MAGKQFWGLTVYLVAVSGWALTQVPGKSPKEALSSEMYTVLKGPTEAVPLQPSALRQWLNRIEAEHMRLEAQNATILEQLQMVLDVRKQVFINTEDLHNVILAVQAHVTQQDYMPSSISVMQTQLSWLLRGLGLLIVAFAGYLIKSLQDARRVLSSVAEMEVIRARQHSEVMEEVVKGEQAASKAYEVGNHVKEKFESLAEKTYAHRARSLRKLEDSE
jgi:hypothetical protein